VNENKGNSFILTSFFLIILTNNFLDLFSYSYSLFIHDTFQYRVILTFTTNSHTWTLSFSFSDSRHVISRLLQTNFIHVNVKIVLVKGRKLWITLLPVCRFVLHPTAACRSHKYSAHTPLPKPRQSEYRSSRI